MGGSHDRFTGRQACVDRVYPGRLQYCADHATRILSPSQPQDRVKSDFGSIMQWAVHGWSAVISRFSQEAPEIPRPWKWKWPMIRPQSCHGADNTIYCHHWTSELSDYSWAGWNTHPFGFGCSVALVYCQIVRFIAISFISACCRTWDDGFRLITRRSFRRPSPQRDCMPRDRTMRFQADPHLPFQSTLQITMGAGY